jgi:hypothetical protein
MGIVTAKRGRSSETKAAYGTTVRFFDVNGERIDSVIVTTVPMAPSRVFKAPAGKTYRPHAHQEEHGSQWIQVEEYKAPDLRVVFDPLAGQPETGRERECDRRCEELRRGAPLDGAEVKWTVNRSARMRGGATGAGVVLPWGRRRRSPAAQAPATPPQIHRDLPRAGRPCLSA